MTWIAVKTRDTARLINTLELTDARPTNWSVGIGGLYAERGRLDKIFVTPPVDGWSFVVGLALPHPMDRSFVDHCSPLLDRLSQTFGVAHYYAALSQMPFYAWVRARDGRIERAFAISEEGMIVNRGALQADERGVGNGLFDLREVQSVPQAKPCYLVEDDVLELARRWSINPMQLGLRDDLTVGVGYVATAPAGWQVQFEPQQVAA